MNEDIKIQKILDEHMDKYMKKHLKLIDDNFTGIFLSGLVSGVIISYSGFLGCLAGFGTGILVGRKYKSITYKVIDFIEKTFFRMLDTKGSPFTFKKDK